MKKIYLILSFAAFTAQAQIINFDTIPIGSTGFDNGSTKPNGKVFVDGFCNFPNSYSTSFGGYWESGWAISTKKDTAVNPSSFSQLLFVKDTGAYTYKNFAVGQQDAFITVKSLANKSMTELYINNTTFAYNSMKLGDAIAKKFGGATGNDPDFFKLTIKGYYNGVQNSDTVDFYLADFRSPNNANDYIIKNWTLVNTSILGVVDSLTFSLSSSDVGAFGINTPLFFCIDKLSFITAFGIDKNKAKADVQTFPNPFNSQLTIKNNSEDGTYAIKDISGKILLSGTLSQNETKIETHALAKGLYTLEIWSDKFISTKKIVKE